MLGFTAESPTPAPSDHIGASLHAARRARRRTLADTADAAGVTKGYLSKVERNLATPATATLVRLCAVLEVPLGSLLSGEHTNALVRASSYVPVTLGGDNLDEYLLTPSGERRVQVLQSNIGPHGSSGDEPYAIPAEVCFALVQHGQLHLSFSERDDVTLNSGDALTFDPRRLHSFVADAAGAQALWVFAPALDTRALDR